MDNIGEKKFPFAQQDTASASREQRAQDIKQNLESHGFSSNHTAETSRSANDASASMMKKKTDEVIAGENEEAEEQKEDTRTFAEKHTRGGPKKFANLHVRPESQEAKDY